jgi:hypothetical protein
MLSGILVVGVTVSWWWAISSYSYAYQSTESNFEPDLIFIKVFMWQMPEAIIFAGTLLTMQRLNSRKAIPG